MKTKLYLKEYIKSKYKAYIHSVYLHWDKTQKAIKGKPFTSGRKWSCNLEKPLRDIIDNTEKSPFCILLTEKMK